MFFGSGGCRSHIINSEDFWNGLQGWNLLSQWLTFKLLGITYLVEKKFKLLFHDPLTE